VSAFFASGFFLLVAGEWRIVRASALLATIVAVLVSLGAIHSLPEAFQRRVASAIEQGDVSQAGTYVGREGRVVQDSSDRRSETDGERQSASARTTIACASSRMRCRWASSRKLSA